MMNVFEPKDIQLKFLRLVKAAMLLLLTLGACSAIAAPTVTATLDRNLINLGESVVLSINFQNCNPGTEIRLPAMTGIRVGGTSTRQNMSMNGASIESTYTYDYELQVSKEGTFTIPTMKFSTSEGQQFTTKPLTFKVVKGAHAESGGEPAFVRIITPRKTVYLGETMVAEIHGYCQHANNPQLQPFTSEGFNIGPILNFVQPVPQVQISNVIYNDVIYRVPITPTKTGKLTLGPATWGITLITGRNMWGQYTGRGITLTSDTPAIDVLPLPTNNVPSNFAGAIGKFTLASFEANPTNVAAGDPITLKIRISGMGAFDSVLLPNLTEKWHEFKSYPPTSKFEPRDQMQIEGTKYFEQVVTPQNSDVKELPAFEFSFFDPTDKTYHTLTHPAIPLTVVPTAATPQPTVYAAATPSNDPPPPAQEIVHIKPALGSIVTTTHPMIERPGFIILLGIAPILWIGATFWRLQKDRLAANPRLRRQREAARLIESGLRELNTLAQSEKVDEFYAGVFRLLQIQLGERLDRPSSAITEAVLDELEPYGLAPQTLATLRELFQLCNQYRYASKGGTKDLKAILPKLESALEDLRKTTVPPTATEKTAIVTLIFLLTGLGLHAGTEDASFNAANKLYEQGKYSDAATAYRKILDAKTVSPALYFNLGNACFKAGHPGNAIWAFKKAEMLSPRDPDIRANLQFTRNQIGTTKAPERFWIRAINHLSLNEWSVLTGIAFTAFFLLLTIRQIVLGARPDTRPQKPLFLQLVVAGIVTIGIVFCLVVSLSYHLFTTTSVVVVSESVARRGPMSESPSVFSMRDGAEVTVIASNNDWVQITDSSARTGWVPTKDLAQITP